MTLFRLLTEGTRALERAGSPDAKQDAQQLLLAAFQMDMVHFLMNRMQELEENGRNQSAAELYRDMIRRRSRRCPLQQILGSQEFMGLEFYVNRYVLIPRQDTETLAELVLKDGPAQALLDLCTGSGCIAISLAVKGCFEQVDASDISEEALKVARRNAEKLSPDQRIEFFLGDLFEALPEDGRKYDVITSNPPYIPTKVIDTLEPEVKEHEPVLALDGLEDGLYYYRRIAKGAGKYLKAGGRIYLEIGYDQGEAVSGLLKQAGYRQICVHKDLPGHDRVVSAIWGYQSQKDGNLLTPTS